MASPASPPTRHLSTTSRGLIGHNWDPRHVSGHVSRVGSRGSIWSKHPPAPDKTTINPWRDASAIWRMDHWSLLPPHEWLVSSSTSLNHLWSGRYIPYYHLYTFNITRLEAGAQGLLMSIYKCWIQFHFPSFPLVGYLGYSLVNSNHFQFNEMLPLLFMWRALTLLTISNLPHC